MKFSVVKKGYDTVEVDDYIAKSEQALEKYRKMELAISNSMICAEETREKIISEAENKAKQIIEAANAEVVEQVSAIRKMLESEKKALADFCIEYDNIIKTYFTANADEVTAPLKEKLLILESVINERESAEKTEEALAEGNNGNTDPFGEIKNYF